MTDHQPQFRSNIGSSDVDHIRLLGHDLASELIGQVGFGELTLWLATGTRPTAGAVKVFEAVLVALADHGLTPIAIAARMTLYSAPDAIQGALAAGLLGGGSRFLGVTEDTGRFLVEALDASPRAPRTATDYDELATKAIDTYRASGRLVPGLGHPLHKNGDPRTPVLMALARSCGTFGPHLALLAAVERVHPAVLGKTLPLNGAGVAGAALLDLELPLRLLRGAALVARAAGLLGHLREELTDPIGPSIYMLVDRNVTSGSPSSSHDGPQT